MRLTTLALTLAALAACSHNKPKPADPTTAQDTPAPGPTKQDKPTPQITTDQQVSPGLAISSDLATMCGIKPAAPQAKFDYDKDDLTADDRAVLDQLATCLSSGALKGKSVALIGRADPRGTEEYNLGLGSRRAQSVSSYLERLGVKQAQLAVTTRGAIDASGTDEASWAQDRRVDIQLAQG